jgi:molecular chaperone GrpE (heat shock protein)
MEISNIFLSIFFGSGLGILLLKLFTPPASSSAQLNNSHQEEIIALRQECQRLREQLETQSQQLKTDFCHDTFAELQPLVTNYPTACAMAKIKPDLPAKNLLSLFTSLENLLENWGYKTIGEPWQQVNYNSQLHQADSDEIVAGELVYIRFVGYRDGDNILYPAKVSRHLPPNLPS